MLMLVLGEAVVLCAVPDGDEDEAAVRQFLRQKLASYKVPKRVLFFDETELVKTGTEKIRIGPLRTAALERLKKLGAEIDGVRF